MCVYSINGDWCVSLGLRIKSNMRTFKVLTLISLVVLTSGVSPTGEGGFIGRVHAIAKRVDDAMKHRAEDIRNRTNQTVETAPDVLSKLWDYVKTNANDPPLGRVTSDVAKLALVQESLLMAIQGIGGCETDEGANHCRRAREVLDKLQTPGTRREL